MNIKSVTGNNKNNKELFQRVKEMKLPIGKYALFGSAPMGIRGLKECNDIDLIVIEELWQEYKDKSGWEFKITKNGVEHIEGDDGNIKIWQDWRPWYRDVAKFINEAEVIDGLPFVRLEHVLQWKKAWGREKDLKDVDIIENYLRNRE